MGSWVLITGGAGYIGSHTVVSLLKAKYNVGIVDNLINSSWNNIGQVLLKFGEERLSLETGDIRDTNFLEKVFQRQRYVAVIHFAALKYPHDSLHNPIEYYDNNVAGTISLVKAMNKFEVTKLVFSSSCTVYGQPQYLPIDEEHSLNPTNPYGRTKFMVEEILKDVCLADSNWQVILLRYFNPTGADPGGLVGEDVNKAYSLMAMVQKAATHGKTFEVFGTDYSTRDGTCERDFIHVSDLADGHVAAVEKILAQQCYGCLAFNMGTGHGTTVIELLRVFEGVIGRKIAVAHSNRREGDVESAWADSSAAEEFLGWKATQSIENMCRHQWEWTTRNSNT